MFNLLTYLEDNFHVEMFNEENVTMPCIRCGKGNKHFLISINPQKPYCHCFRCGYKTSVAGLISQLQGISYDEAKEITENTFWIKPKIKKDVIERISLPMKEVWTDEAWDYLINRGLTRELIWKYDLYLTTERPYYNRIIIPVYFNGIPVTFQARSINNYGLRYLSPRDNPIGRILYNYDNIKGSESVILAEGIFDVFGLAKAGFDNVACSFGKKVSMEQINLLEKKGVKEVILMYDSDAISKIKEIFIKLQKHFKVSIAPLLEGDPGDCNDFTFPFSNLIDNIYDLNEFIMWKFKNHVDNSENQCYNVEY